MASSENVCKYPIDYYIVGYHVVDNHAVGIISNSICLKVYYLWLTGNHALHRSAWQNSARLPYNGAGRAVDGRFTKSKIGRGQCAVSEGGQTAEWQMDLGDIRIIQHALIQCSRDGRNEQIQTNTNENIWLDRESNPGPCITSQVFNC